MSEKKQLNEEQLEKVSGGTVTKDMNTYWVDYNFPVGKYEGVIGTTYLFVGKSGDPEDWVFGQLVNTYEEAWERKRIHDVLIMDGVYAFCSYGVGGGKSPLNYGSTLEIYGDDYQMYRKKNQ